MNIRFPEQASGALAIRRAQNGPDWEAIRRICCETGNAGSPIDPARWPFFAEHWVGPYQKLRPEWTYVATPAPDSTTVTGYLTGCPDTAGFRREKLLRFSLPLLLKSLGPWRAYPWNGDIRRFTRRTLLLEKGPEQSFPRTVLRELGRSYPAHLHVNVDQGSRSGGIGARLMEAYLRDLRKAGVPGVHLFCGPAPLAFYGRSGFKTLATHEFQPGVIVYLLGRKV